MTVERLVTLEGGTNFRDVGGYETAGGGRVRWGLVFRSGALHRLTAADLASLAALGLRVVYDLRSDEERDLAPSMTGGIRYEPLPISGDAARTEEHTALFIEGRLTDVPADFLVHVYQAMAEGAAPIFGELLTRLAEPDGLPALVHCTAGKDRTGIAAALLLSVLGVDDAAIVDDYELSRIHYSDPKLARLLLKDETIDVERYRSLFGAPRDAMALLLTGLRDRYGSVERYLVDAAGVAPEVIAELRARLVERPSH